MPPSVILFTGAPPASSVTADSCTLDQFDETFARFLGLEKNTGSPENQQVPSSHAAWRSLPLARQPLRTGFSQTHDVSDDALWGRPQFFTTADVAFGGEDSAGIDTEAVLTQFCEHSLAALNSLSPAQLDSFNTSASEETSFLTTSSAGQTNAAAVAPALPSAHLSDLEDIPPAARIMALNPQTVTLNLIVGIISIAQPRTVTTRWGNAMTLVEVLVGDDTGSGFAVTFWLSAATGGAVRMLRRQDVVLMQNVALHVFRGKVYGQSLRRDMTKVDLLWRRDGGGCYSARALAKREPASHPQQEKARLVKDWVLKFVGGDPTSKAKTALKSWDKPPDDTQ